MATRTRRVLVTLAVVVLVVVAGCAGSGGDAADNRKSHGGGAGDAAPTGGDSGEANDGGEQRKALEVQRRALIRTGNVTLQVEEFDASQRNLTQAVRNRGGFVSDSSQEVNRRGNETWTSGTLVLRVPSERFSALFQRVEREGEVQQSSTGTEDVTDRLVDLEARLENLRSQRDRLRGLYDDANDTEDVLAVQQRLSDVQSEIERLEATKQSLEDRVAYSTITVKLAEPEPEPEPKETSEKSWYETGVLAAFLDSVDGVVVVLRATVVAAAYLLPYVVVFGVPLVGAYALLRRYGSSGRVGSDEE